MWLGRGSILETLSIRKKKEESVQNREVKQTQNMNYTNLTSIKDKVALTKRIPGIKKQAQFFMKALALTTKGSKKNIAYDKLLKAEMEKLRYIEKEVPGSVVVDEATTDMPRITLHTRESGYSARQLGVDPKSLREGNFNVDNTAELKAYVTRGYNERWSPASMKAFIKVAWLSD